MWKIEEPRAISIFASEYFLNMDKPDSIPNDSKTLKGKDPFEGIPEYDTPWICPQRPAPPAPKIEHPEVKIKLLVKDPDRRRAHVPPVEYNLPAVMANKEMSSLLSDLAEDLGHEHEIEKTIPGRPRTVELMLGWVNAYAKSPKPNQYPPKTQIQMKQNRFLKNPPPIVENPEEEELIAQTLPLWDIEYFHLTHIIDPADNEPDGAYQMDKKFLSPGGLWELLNMANELGMHKFMIHLRKVYHLAYLCGHLPDEITDSEKMTSEDLDYWANAFVPIKEAEVTPEPEAILDIENIEKIENP